MPADLYRPLSAEEIKLMRQNGCWTDNWESVQVTEGFDARRVAGTVFRGNIRLGRLDGEIDLDDGVIRYCGIFDSNLNNISLGDNCHISNVSGWLSNLEIADQVLIENVGSIACSRDATFGNGHEIEALNEGGGRELKMTALTSAQIAYVTALYRHDEELVKSLNALADAFTDSVRSDTAYIGANAIIQNCSSLKDVLVGPFARLTGVQAMENGSVVSSKESPSLVGEGVIAKHFIIQQGSQVEDGALLTATLIGEGCRIGRQFSAENTLIFANSEGFHSEAVALFAGPYTVTHHRSTLLIAGMTSFFNAGSGSNQSNHLYKLGPVHQGILERGCKTGSFSYLLWPSRVGAFSVVMGKHYQNFDTGDMPFSYVNEEDGRSALIPAMNYFTVGTFRDGAKWPQRDRRAHDDRLDQLHFEVLSPYTVQKVIRGRETLMKLYQETPRSQDAITHNGIIIKRLLLKTCSRYYAMILDKYFGDIIAERLLSDKDTVHQALTPDETATPGEADWVDVSGLLCDQDRLGSLLDTIKSIEVGDQSALLAGFQELHTAYAADEWNWILNQFTRVYDQDLNSISRADLLLFFEKWQKSSRKLLNMVLMDAEKEFGAVIQTGFGIDGHKEADFTAVRGNVENEAFTAGIHQQITVLD